MIFPVEMYTSNVHNHSCNLDIDLGKQPIQETGCLIGDFI